MPSPCDPEAAPAGDVGTAMLLIDSRLKQFRKKEPDEEQRHLTDQLLRSFDAKAAGDVLDGACTLIYLFTQWLRQVHEAEDRDVLEYVVPYVVRTLKAMKRSIPPEAIPTMAGLIISSAIDQSPTLWRRRYGQWNEEEMTALEATAFLLAQYINDLTEDDETATRMIMELLSSVEKDDPITPG
jgi:hypothetical protein